MYSTKEITIKVNTCICDTCHAEFTQDSNGLYKRMSIVGLPSSWIEQCVKCGNNFCSNCSSGKDMESCDDGSLCSECSKQYEFNTTEGISVVDKTTKKSVEAPWL
jgi:hypothetical protein